MSEVSWLLPVRDGRAWLREAVDSVLAELGPADELIVIDDGSADHPEDCLPRDPRLRLIPTPPQGIAGALEVGRRVARGALLARIDADDVVLPGRIAAQRALLDADPGLAVVGGRGILRPGAGEGMRRYLDWLNALTDLGPALLIESPILHPAATLRAAAVAEVGGWRSGDLPEDYDLWLRLAGAGHRLGAVAREVVLIRDRPERLTRTDPRYRREAFTRLKLEHAARHLLPGRRRIAIWGAGRSGRPWRRLAGSALVAVVDRFIIGTRQGKSVWPPEALAELDLDLLLVAVGAQGAREEIRADLARIRPDLIEGAGWWAVA